MKKKILSLIALLFVIVLPFGLVACDNNDDVKILDVYNNRSSLKELTTAYSEFVLPVGWSVLTESINKANGDIGYIPEIDSFIITDGQFVSIIKSGEEDALFSTSTSDPSFFAITAIKYVNGVLLVKRGDGSANVFDMRGDTILSKKNFVTNIQENEDINNVFKVLDNNMVAIAPEFDMNARAGYVSIYKLSNEGSVADRGELVCRVKNSEINDPLSKMLGFDNMYVTVVDTKEDGDAMSRIFRIPNSAGSSVKNLNGTQNGRVSDNGESGYFSEITYIGNDQFLVHEDWTVGSEEAYTYSHADENVLVSRHIYNARFDSLTSYSSQYIFLNLSNKYYDGEKNGVDTSSMLKGDYMYSPYGLYINPNKKADYDQFILDGNLNVIYSLTRNFELTLVNQEVDDVSAFDLILDFVDGKGYSPIMPTIMRVYDTDGNISFENRDHEIVSATANNGIIVAKSMKGSNTNEQVFGAFDMQGKVVIPFEYDQIDPFRGYYTIAVTTEGKRVLIGKDGNVVEDSDFNGDGEVEDPLADMALTSNKKPVQKMGCYVNFIDVKEGEKTVRYFGLRNLNPSPAKSMILPTTMSEGPTLYSPKEHPEHVFLFEKITNEITEKVSYKIYRIL